MIKKTLGLGVLCLTCSLPSIAGTMGDDAVFPEVYLGVFGGYGKYEGGVGQDGNVTQLRLTLGARAPQAYTYKNFQIGGELGVQTGNSQRLSATTAVSALNGGLPFQATVKPLIDLLATLTYKIQPDSPYAVILKGGIAYRQLQLDGVSSNKDSLSKVNGEFQAGLGYRLSEHAQLTAMYQGIYSSSNAGVNFVSTNNLGFVNAGYFTVSQIPTQNSGFLGIDYTF
ncbi:MAG: hypothetical protein NXI01_07485 [Gammaproteobacteria bacterium]|nr:hypothetical protein [Gammaproteobacteria bacterium]